MKYQKDKNYLKGLSKIMKFCLKIILFYKLYFFINKIFHLTSLEAWRKLSGHNIFDCSNRKNPTNPFRSLTLAYYFFIYNSHCYKDNNGFFSRRAHI